MAQLARVGRIAAGVIVATAMFEAVLRLVEASPLWHVAPVPEVSLYGPDDAAGYRHRPNLHGIWLEEHRSLVETSSLGLRDRERSLARSSAPRAVVVGNSYVEALQVALPQTAVAVAEQRLQPRWPGAEVVNLGLTGASAAVDVTRLQTIGADLHADLALLLFPIRELWSTTGGDDSSFVGYRPGTDGMVALSHGFRASAGYRFRTSRAGELFYWLLDHSAVVRVLNNRKNVGLFAEWPGAPRPRGEGPEAADYCIAQSPERELALWNEGKPDRAGGILAALIRDLGAAARERPIIVLATEQNGQCRAADARRRAVVQAMQARFAAAGLRFVDLDARMAEAVGADRVAGLYGFGAHAGAGHFNAEGNRVVGEILATVIGDALATRDH